MTTQERIEAIKKLQRRPPMVPRLVPAMTEREPITGTKLPRTMNSAPAYYVDPQSGRPDPSQQQQGIAPRASVERPGSIAEIAGTEITPEMLQGQQQEQPLPVTQMEQQSLDPRVAGLMTGRGAEPVAPAPITSMSQQNPKVAQLLEARNKQAGMAAPTNTAPSPVIKDEAAEAQRLDSQIASSLNPKEDNSWMNMLHRGVEGLVHGKDALSLRQQRMENDRQLTADRVARLNALKGGERQRMLDQQGVEQQQEGAADREYARSRRPSQERADALAEETAQSNLDKANKPQLQEIPADTEYGYFDAATKKFTSLGRTAARPQTQAAPRTVTTDEGVFVLNPDGSRGNRLGGRPGAAAEAAPPSAPTPAQIAAGDISQFTPNVQALAKQLVEYKIPLPTGMALSNPKSVWNAAIQAAGILDPTFDATQYPARLAMRKDFTSGKAAQTITALNTVIGHLDTLNKNGQALENAAIPIFNRGVNVVKTGTGNPAVKNFDVAKNAVADELLRVFRSTGGTETEVQSWKEQFDSSGSPEQLKGAINQAVELIGSRVSALQDQYDRGFGKPQNFKFFTPKSEKILQELSGESPTATPTAPGGSISVTAPDGSVHPFATQAEADAFKRLAGIP